MDDSEKERAARLADQLKDAGYNCGLVSIEGKVVMLSPNQPPLIETLMPFSEADFKNAIELGYLEKKPLSVTYEWEAYRRKKP